MREHRWESCESYGFQEVLALADRLSRAGFSIPRPDKDVIAYIEDWEVADSTDIDQLEAWPIEDVTLIHILEKWSGDFFLLAGRYHTVFERHRSLDTYCSICHPFRFDEPFATLLPEALFWVGFRHTHSFIRVRVQTCDILAPGDVCPDGQRTVWVEERLAAFDAAIRMLDVPITATEEHGRVSLTTSQREAALFCSWPDAFGPCQFEYNSSDAYEFLVPASRLAATMETQPVTVRCYLTGFSEPQLQEFHALSSAKRMAYRCSVHTAINELPDIQPVLGNSGRVYTTLCEFRTQPYLRQAPNASAIMGIVGRNGTFHFEVRLNQLPLPRPATTEWLTTLLQVPLTYAPLPAFP